MQDVASKVREVIQGIEPNEREAAISEIRKVIDSELFTLSSGTSDGGEKCPCCKGSALRKYGTTKKGSPRLQCKSCGKVFALREGGRIMGYTHLSRDVWMKFAVCFVDGVTINKTAAICDVTRKTAWFMRRRMMEAVKNLIPSFQVKSGCGAQIDEIYFNESFKGIPFKNLTKIPRNARHNGNASKKHGISDDKICLMTGINDNEDTFFECACRGAMTLDVARDVLKERILSGAIVNTDRHKSYPKVLSELGVAIHNAHDDKEHAPLNKVNSLHSEFRRFLSPFRGVSTKWLEHYALWFKWIKSFSRSERDDNLKLTAKHISLGDYLHKRSEIGSIPIPFRDADMNPVKR